MQAREQAMNGAQRGRKSCSSPHPAQEGIWSATQMEIIGFIINTSCYFTALCVWYYIFHMHYKYVLIVLIFTCNVLLFLQI